ILALTSLRITTVLRLARQLVLARHGPHAAAALRRDDVTAIHVRADEPADLQVDGDHLGQRTEVTFRQVPAAPRVWVEAPWGEASGPVPPGHRRAGKYKLHHAARPFSESIASGMMARGCGSAAGT